MPQSLSTHQRKLNMQYYGFRIFRDNREVKSFIFILNPETLNQNEPARTAVTQTKGTFYVDNYGIGPKKIRIQGTTGYKERINLNGAKIDGFTAFLELRNDIYRYFLGESSKDDGYELRFHNFEDDEHYEVMPEPGGFTLQRSKREPLLYRYDFAFICLRSLTQTDKKEVFLGQIPVETVGDAHYELSEAINMSGGILNVPEIARR